uniref:Interferon regulatory factor 9 n=1 Tax=Cavia porcellus TaxID=10141 RepID=H0VZ53_CAVPO
MASGRVRRTRKLRNWVVEQVESGQFPGVCWDDEPAKTMFRIPWKHAGKQDFREDQDALFFKAWAIFKGKYKDGNTEGPAVWKTRLRCALNKSTEFEEVPERGRMDIAEPYKVYRLLPPETLPGECLRAQPPSRLQRWDGSTGLLRSLGLLGAGHPDSGSSGSSGSSSPEPQEGTTSSASVSFVLYSLAHGFPNFSLLLTFIYSGRVVSEHQVHSLDCRLVAEASESESSIKQVMFPKPDPGDPSQRLLSQLEKGILVASNSRGLFVQCLCPIPIYWTAPQDPPGPGPHLLPSNKCVELFKTACFYRDFGRYSQGLGPQPKSQVTLHFWEESPGPSHTLQTPITVQMEQAFARHLLKRSLSCTQPFSS